MTVAFINAWGILVKGGPMMWPILLLSIFALVIGIEKILYLNFVDKKLNVLRLQFLTAVRENRMKDALIICETDQGCLGRIFKAGLIKYGSSVDLMRSSMEQAAGFEIHDLKQRMSLLAFIVNAAPLLGLLGTTASLCVVFHAVQMRSNALNPLSLGDMSSGIWQSLITSSAGLVVSIIAFSVYSFCLSRLNDLIRSMEQSMDETVVLLQAVCENGRSQQEEQA